MPEWIFVSLGVFVGLAIIGGVIFLVTRPRPLRHKKSRLPERSGLSDEDGWSRNTSGCTHDS